MNKHYLSSLMTYQAGNMFFYIILSAIFGMPMTVSGALICFGLGVLVHKHLGYKGEK